MLSYVDFLLQQIDLAINYDSLEAVKVFSIFKKALTVPCLIIHGVLDKDIPIQQGRNLFKAALKGKPFGRNEIAGYGVSMQNEDAQISLLELEYAGHNNLHQYDAAIAIIEEFTGHQK
jgi:pimeloyl-ACP methyl ester carboxylesterase